MEANCRGVPWTLGHENQHSSRPITSHTRCLSPFGVTDTTRRKEQRAKSKEQLADQRWLGPSGWLPLSPHQHMVNRHKDRRHTHTRRKLTRHKHTRHKYTCSRINGRVYSTDPGHGSVAGSQAPQARSTMYINIGRSVSASYHRHLIGPPPDAPCHPHVTYQGPCDVQNPTSKNPRVPLLVSWEKLDSFPRP
jgi:hypothetical protein